MEELKKDLESLVQKAQETGKSNISYIRTEESGDYSGEKGTKSTLPTEDAQYIFTPRRKNSKPLQKVEKTPFQEQKLSCLVQRFQSIGADENKEIKKISNEITRLYRSINKMASDAREKYGLDLTALEPKTLNQASQPFPKPQLSLLEVSFSQSPLKLASSKSKKERPEYTIKFRDNKVPSKLMKQLLKHQKSQQNESGLSSNNNSRLILRDIEYNKFGLQNKKLPSVYD